jgi:uncharacterized membrane protein YtjA (UPF0391 family)
VPATDGSPNRLVPATLRPAPRREVRKPADRHHSTPAHEDDGATGPLGVIGFGRRAAASTGTGVAALVVVALVVLLLFPMVAARWARRRG